MTGRFFVMYARPGEKPHRVGSDDGHADAATALFWMKEGSKTAQPGGVVSVVDEAGERTASIEMGDSK